MVELLPEQPGVGNRATDPFGEALWQTSVKLVCFLNPVMEHLLELLGQARPGRQFLWREAEAKTDSPAGGNL
jgi:hypothetical protein